MALQHLRSSTANKRPLPGSMSDGQIAINTNTSSPGLFFKDSAGALVKVGPVHVGSTAPNASPAGGGETGNSVGEQWLDTSGSTYVFKVWDGSAWRSESGTFVDVNGDTMTGALGIIAGSAAAPGVFFSGDTNTGIYSPGADQVAISTGGSGRLFVDASGRVLVGTPSARSNIDGGNSPQVQIEGAGYPAATFSITRDSADTGAPIFYFAKTRSGSVGGNTVVQSSDTLGQFIWTGSDGTNTIKAAEIKAEVDGTPGANDMPGRIVLSTTADGASSPTERLRITSAGLVGIGVSSPSSLLHLQGSASNLVRAYTTDTGTSNVISVNNDSNYHYGILGTVSGNGTATGDVFGLGYTSVLTSDFTPVISWTANTNRVGIGSTNPGFKLDVASASGSSTVSQFSFTGGNSVFLKLANASNAQGFIGYETQDLTFYTNNTEKLRIDSSGRLLVGTSSSFQGSNFEVAGLAAVGASGNDAFSTALVISKTRGATVNSQTVVQNGDELGSLIFRGSDGNSYKPGAVITASVNGTPGANDMPGRLVFSVTRDGESSPTGRAQIDNTGRFYAFVAAANDGAAFMSAEGAGTVYQIFAGWRSVTNVGGASAQLVFQVFTNGNTQNTNNSYTGISDLKLKENVVDAGSQWSDIKELRVRKYNFKEETGHETHTQIGLIAQEAELVSPGLVIESPDRNAEGKILGTTTKSVNYSVLYMKAVKALQEAMERIEQLETEMAAVKAQLS